MRSIAVLAISVWLTLAACAQLPRLVPQDNLSEQPEDCDCDSLFAEGDWQFVHVIEAAPPDGQRYSMLGVCHISSATRSIRSALMTLEGLVIFQADYNGRNITVQRALPPFNAQGFAEGLIDDLALLFLAPDGTQHKGRERDGSAQVCRWSRPNGTTVDIVHRPDMSWEIRRYDTRARAVRIVKPLKTNILKAKGPANESIVLESPGILGYTLTMTLVEAQSLTPPSALPEANP